MLSCDEFSNASRPLCHPLKLLKALQNLRRACMNCRFDIIFSLQDTDETMMSFSYEWKQHPVLFNNTECLRIQVKGNAVMCLAIQQAKEEISKALGMDGKMKQQSTIHFSHKYMCSKEQCFKLCLFAHFMWNSVHCCFAVGAVAQRLRKYHDGCNRVLPLWEKDIKACMTTNLKLPSVRKLHIFCWLLPHCKHWQTFMQDHNFDLYFPKLSSLEERNLKRRKIEPQIFEPTNVLPSKVLHVLCDVYRKVMYVTRVMPYMYTEECLEFRCNFVDHIVGFVRVVTPEEELCVAQPVVCMEVDTFYLHLSEALQVVAREKSFHQSHCDIRNDAVKTTAGGKSLTLLSRMVYTMHRWVQNMHQVLTLMQAKVAYASACVFAIEYDESEGVQTPRKGFADELDAAVHKAVTDKQILQHSMASLRHEFRATRCTFAPSTVDWFKHAVALKRAKYACLPSFVS